MLLLLTSSLAHYTSVTMTFFQPLIILIPWTYSLPSSRMLLLLLFTWLAPFRHQHHLPWCSNWMFPTLFSSLFTPPFFSSITQISVQCFIYHVYNRMLKISRSGYSPMRSGMTCVLFVGTTQCLTHNTSEIQMPGDMSDPLILNHPYIP